MINLVVVLTVVTLAGAVVAATPQQSSFASIEEEDKNDRCVSVRSSETNEVEERNCGPKEAKEEMKEIKEECKDIAVFKCSSSQTGHGLSENN